VPTGIGVRAQTADKEPKPEAAPPQQAAICQGQLASSVRGSCDVVLSPGSLSSPVQLAPLPYYSHATIGTTSIGQIASDEFELGACYPCYRVRDWSEPIFVGGTVRLATSTWPDEGMHLMFPNSDDATALRIASQRAISS